MKTSSKLKKPATKPPVVVVEPALADWPKVGERIALTDDDKDTDVWMVVNHERGLFLLRDARYENTTWLVTYTEAELGELLWICIPEPPAKRGFWSKLFGGAE